MDRSLLLHLPAVLAVARRGGFAAAAAELGTTASNVSHAVRTVEDRLGLPLFARTTRSVAPTEAGAAFVAAAAPALEALGEAWDRARSAARGVSGRLRLNVPRIALAMAVTPVVPRLAALHPDLVLDVVVDDGLADIVRDGFDAGVRLGETVAEDMVAVRLTPPFRALVVGAPAYLDRAGRPTRAAELGRHACIGFRFATGGGLYRWELREDGRDVAVETRGPATTTDAEHAVELALAGVGLAYAYEPLVRRHLEEGRLEAVLADRAIEEPGLFLYYPRRASMAPKLRAFVELARWRG